MLAAGQKRETARLGPETSYLCQVHSAFRLIPSLGITAVKDFPCRVKTKPKQKPNPDHPCLKQPRCGIQGWGGAVPMVMGHNTPTQERNQGHGKCRVSCRLCDNAPSALTTPRTESKAQADRPPTPPAEGKQREASCQKEVDQKPPHGRWAGTLGSLSIPFIQRPNTES